MSVRQTAAVLLAALVSAQGCARPDVRVAAGAPEPKTVAVMAFENRSESPEPIGDTAADLFAAALLKSGRYRVLIEAKGDREVKLKTTTEEGKIEVVASENRADPFAAAARLKADAVLVGSVTRYRHRQGFIFPPALVSIEAKLMDARTHEILWSAADTRKYGAWRWLSLIAWPIGLTLAFFSPPADERLKQSVERTAREVEARLSARR